MPRTIADTLLTPFLYIANSVLDSTGTPTRAPYSDPLDKMTTPKSSPTLKPTRTADTTDQRRVVSENNALHPLSPSLHPPSSPDRPHPPDTSEDLSTESRVPLLTSSVASSTPYSVKYTRLPQGDLFETPTNTESSSDRTFSTPSVNNSASSASMEIFLGPQPKSYVHHRQRLLDDDFERSPSRPSPAMLAAKASYAVTINADNNDRSKSEKNDTDTVHLSAWRQKQLKKFKPGRPVAGARERLIPTLHGPLSLPYARNPSGVDATVPDQTSYMTHVFGLRAASISETKSSMGKTTSTTRISRIPSDSTNRTTSGSSCLSTEGMSDYPSSSSGSLSSIKRPVMVRDPTQVTGLKKDPSMDGGKVNFNSDRLLPPSESNQHRTQAETRSQLGIGKPLSPIPGSPPPAPSFGMAIDSAIHSAGIPTSQRFTDHGHDQSDFVSLALVDPVTNSVFNVRVPKSPNASPLGSIPCEIVPTGSKFNAPHQSAASKADASANWRNRTSSVPSVHVSGSPGQGALPSLPGSLYSHAKSPVEVLTIDQLSQKFGAMRMDSHGKTDKPSAATTHKKGEKSISKMEPAAKTLADSTGRQVNIDTPKPSSKKKLRISTNKKSSSPTTSRIKGTPGAGKHLKAQATEEADAPFKPKATIAAK